MIHIYVIHIYYILCLVDEFRVGHGKNGLPLSDRDTSLILLHNNLMDEMLQVLQDVPSYIINYKLICRSVEQHRYVSTSWNISDGNTCLIRPLKW